MFIFTYNIKVLLYILVIGIVFTSCSQHNFNPNSKYMALKSGTPYLVPEDSTFRLIVGDGYISKGKLNALKKYSIDSCHTGDMMWIDSTWGDKYINPYKNKDFQKPDKTLFKNNPCLFPMTVKRVAFCGSELEEYGDSYIAYRLFVGMKTGHIGCSKPLSKESYAYYKNLEYQQQISNARDRANNARFWKQVGEIGKQYRVPTTNSHSSFVAPRKSIKTYPTTTNTYQGNSGRKYKYDLSDSSQKIDYQYDLDAQRRDQYDLDTGGQKARDKSYGQNGGGVY